MGDHDRVRAPVPVHQALFLNGPAKFVHFGAFIKKDKWEKYAEEYLGNEHLAKEGRSPRPEITGHLHEVEINAADADLWGPA